MRKATFAELESGSKRFIAIGVSRSKSLPKLYIYSLPNKHAVLQTDGNDDRMKNIDALYSSE